MNPQSRRKGVLKENGHTEVDRSKWDAVETGGAG